MFFEPEDSQKRVFSVKILIEKTAKFDGIDKVRL